MALRVSPRNGSRRLSRRAREASDTHFELLADALRAPGPRKQLPQRLFRMEPELEWLRAEYHTRQMVRAYDEANQPAQCRCCARWVAAEVAANLWVFDDGRVVCEDCEDDGSSVSTEDSDDSEATYVAEGDEDEDNCVVIRINGVDYWWNTTDNALFLYQDEGVVTPENCPLVGYYQPLNAAQPIRPA